MSNPAQPPEKSWLSSQFDDLAPEAHGAGWSKIWDVGKADLWDRGQASPALVDVIELHQKPGELFHPFTADGRRRRVLVPGCGRGYDVAMLALHGFDAYGLDISATGVAAAEAFASRELQSPGAANFGPNHDNREDNKSRGSVKFLQGDFFSSEWESELGGRFDLVYDYTFLCALHPTMRKDWATRMASLLEKDGLLTCLEFPMYKDRTLPGPPWGLNGVHWNLLAKGGDGIAIDDAGNEKEGEGSFTRILYVQPERTHEAGQGTDMLSVYQRK